MVVAAAAHAVTQTMAHAHFIITATVIAGSLASLLTYIFYLACYIGIRVFFAVASAITFSVIVVPEIEHVALPLPIIAVIFALFLVELAAAIFVRTRRSQ